ncbi:MAG: hypothetical protein HYT87_07985 [Nitrospirae bacterium]|nr:hypothetical protein [Nitrospirota bacterium]
MQPNGRSLPDAVKPSGTIPKVVMAAAVLSCLLACRLAFREELSPDEIHRWLLAQLHPRDMFQMARSITGGNELFLLMTRVFVAIHWSPLAVRVANVLIHGLTVLLAYRWFSAWLGRRVAGFVAIWIAGSPLHVYEAYDLKEYSGAVLIGLWAVRLGLESPEPALKRSIQLGLIQMAGTAFTLTLGPFWGAYAVTQCLTAQKRSRRWMALMVLQHAPWILIGLLTLHRWDAAYRPIYFSLHAQALSSNPLKIVADFFSHVYLWVWLPWAQQPVECVPPMAHWLSNGFAIGQWVIGGPLLLAFFWPSNTHRQEKDLPAAKWCYHLPIWHLALYLAATGIMGSPHWYIPRVYLASSPFVFARIAATLGERKVGWRIVMLVPAALAALVSMIGLVRGTHPSQLPSLRKSLQSAQGELQGVGPIYIYPGTGFHYVQTYAPPDVRSRLRPVWKDVIEDPSGWGTILAPISPEEKARFKAELTGQEDAWLIGLPDLLSFRDPHLSIMQSSGRQWKTLSCSSHLLLYRSLP